jgi:pyruvate,water dikinase
LSERFPSPFDITTPPGAEGWEELYSYHIVFSDDRRPYEDGRFWFQDGMHWPKPVAPWDATIVEYAVPALSQCNTRLYAVPPARGIDVRVLNGYVYMSPVAVSDPAEVAERVPHFIERAGFYYERWDELYARWVDKVHAVLADLEALRFEPLPEMEPLDRVTTAQGTGSGFELLAGYQRLLELVLKVWQYHFEFLNLGYGAYLDYFSFCKQAFPGMPELAIAKTVAGVEVDLFRPDEEVKGLARLALELGVGEVFASWQEPDVVLTTLAESAPGRQWLERFEAVRQPWFNFSSGGGMYHSDRIWTEDLSIPFGFLAGYLARLARGESIERPVDEIRAERERIATEYEDLLEHEEDRRAFREKLALARTVFPYVENHNFYVEHWTHSVIWRKMRGIGQILQGAAFLPEADDVFYLRRTEVTDALLDYYAGWATGVEPRGPEFWPARVERRRGIMAALSAWSPPKALGTPPPVVTEPFTVMLWGITRESIGQWLGQSTGARDLSGFAASPGVAEGPARVIASAEEMDQVEEGDVLVAPLTAPSWAPIFSKIAATVTETGGIMSHAAIVCREYGLPAVTGAASATARIKTGQRIRVDGTAGTVTLLD